MQIGCWMIDEKDEGFVRRLERAKQSDLTPLGLRKDIGYAVFSGRHGIYNTTLSSCNCYDFSGDSPCKHIIRLSMEMGLINEQFSSNLSDVKYPVEPSHVTKKVFVDSTTGEVFEDRPYPIGPLNGKTIVITGVFEQFTRDEITTIINKAGGKVSGSVSKKTTLLVAGSEPGSKLERAKQLGIPVISDKELIELIEKG